MTVKIKENIRLTSDSIFNFNAILNIYGFTCISFYLQYLNDSELTFDERRCFKFIHAIRPKLSFALSRSHLSMK